MTHGNNGILRGVPVAKICDTRPVFYIASLPTHPLRHNTSYNDIHVTRFINIHYNCRYTPFTDCSRTTVSIQTMSADSRSRKRKHCECGFELTGLSTYHQAEHKRSKRHRRFEDSASCSRMENFFTKSAAPRSTQSQSAEILG